MELEEIYEFYKGNLATYRDLIMDAYNDGNMSKLDYSFLMEATEYVNGVFQDCIEGYITIDTLIEVMNLSITLFEGFAKKEIDREEFEMIMENKLDEIYGVE